MGNGYGTGFRQVQSLLERIKIYLFREIAFFRVKKGAL